MRALLAILLLTGLAFAGCAGADQDPDGDAGRGTPTSSATGTQSATSTRTGSSTASASTTGTGTTTPNRAPTAQLAASTVGGSLQVNYTIDAADADGDALTWSLAFGDGSSANGTAVPANRSHVFAAAGNYSATLVVSDGQLDGTATVNLNLTADPAAPAGQSFSGEWVIGSVDIPFAATLGGGCDAVAPMDGVFVAVFDVDPATFGLPYTATVSAATTSGSIVAWEVKFLDAEGKCAPIGIYQDGSAPITGTVPDGVEFAWMSSDGGASVTGSYHAG